MVINFESCYLGNLKYSLCCFCMEAVSLLISYEEDCPMQRFPVIQINICNRVLLFEY